jgi:ADP-heptose:LPS heptosyltransferase
VTEAGGPQLSGTADRSVLVLRSLGLGDGLTAVPALRGLRRAYPGHRLVIVSPAEVGSLLKRFGVVDEVVVSHGLRPLPPSSVVRAGQIAVNLHGCGPQSHRLLQATRPAELIAFASEAAGHQAGPAWSAEEHEVDRWCRLVRWAGGACGREDLRLLPGQAGTSGLLVVHPGAASTARRWPAQRWAEVVARVSASGWSVLVTGGPAERELCAEVARGSSTAVNLGAALSLQQLAEVVAEADLVVCGDTGVAHLATAFSTPSVLLFGPTPPGLWGPAIDPHLHAVIWRGAAERRGDPHADQVDANLQKITVTDVMAEIERQITRQDTCLSFRKHY